MKRERSLRRIIKLNCNIAVFESKVLSHGRRAGVPSLYISLPQPVVRSMNLQKGDIVKVTITKLEEEEGEERGVNNEREIK